MLKFLGYLGGLAFLLWAGQWVWQEKPQVRAFVGNYFDMSNEFHTLEARFTAEQIMERERKTLLKDGSYTYLEPMLQFYPYALFEVKYSKASSQTSEGLLLWSLHNGELVLNTTTWETTHGFEDCIRAGAIKSDFRLLNCLANEGPLGRDDLLFSLRMEENALDELLESCRKKKLIVQQGRHWRLHFAEPKFATKPETKIDQWLVTKPYKGSECARKKYSLSQMEKLAQAAFDQDFAIRSTSEVYLPVYSITVQNPDGSKLTTLWNALNGKRITENGKSGI